MSPEDLKNDPRLNGMDKEKLELLIRLANEAEQNAPDGLLPLLLRITQNRQNADFTDSETDLIFSILTADLTPAQKKQAETIRTLSRSFVRKKDLHF